MSPPALLPYRDLARTHLAAARALLAGEGAALRYACLETRLALEALTYDVLQTYQDDDDARLDAALQDWHPRKILEAIGAYDPIGEGRLVVRLRIRPEGGEWTELEGREARFSADWASKAHYGLSHFLHQLTLSQLRRGRGLDEAKLRRKTDEVIEALQAILDNPFNDLRLGFRFGYPCPDCQGPISVALIPLIVAGRVRTRCEACGAA